MGGVRGKGRDWRAKGKVGGDWGEEGEEHGSSRLGEGGGKAALALLVG